ncbi:MAG: sugar phosphate isomerase/epimerase [Chloroflexi bacterium]|nr:sugar phosphate isomerase/epimerase [Chloroflexota bacterium]MCI0576870.1 sugar phosphate isomerase/epimerase [Chloroflexota bacterium]MCI0646476.1 sugar phosphate isomerase/epimerase [Chloroflexota bacterium]MCI0726172.1 sugar phosphate isomerase/epimerase [Chloroflexota bacterium]
MDISICSYSFHRLLEAGKQDVFKYISDCRELGATKLDLWNGHLRPLLDDPARPPASFTPEYAQLSPAEGEYLVEIRAAAGEAGLPFGCLAVDGAHIYEASPEGRQANRMKAYRWLAIAERLGAEQIRLDAGGAPEMPEEMFEMIVAGYDDLIRRAGEKGLEVIMENHWGASKIPENVVRILEAVNGLGLLFDTANWAEGTQEQGWALCARYARATHIKTFAFDAAGNETTTDIPRAIGYLVAAGYNGCWGIESCPRDGDEYGGARKTIALIRRVLDGI